MAVKAAMENIDVILVIREVKLKYGYKTKYASIRST